MATLIEVERGLPSGFHDALISSCTLDYVARTAIFILQVSVGDPDSSDELERDRYRPARLLISGLAFCQIEAPDTRYPYAEPKPLFVDLCEPEKSHLATAALPSGVFSGRFFVSNWNSFIHIAGDHATLDWLDGDPAPTAEQ